MNTFNVKRVSEQSLSLLMKNGASAKIIQDYRTTVFGEILRHFALQGCFDVDSNMINEFILEQRKRFERGEIAYYKWQHVRRGSELLKHYAETGTMDMSVLRRWEPILQRSSQSVEFDTPTPEQMADTDNLFALVWRVRQELYKKGLTESTIRHYTSEGLAVILRKHIDHGLERYSESLVTQIMLEKRTKYENGKTSRVSYQNLRKASYLLLEMYRTGDITLSMLPNWKQREPIPEFAKLLQHFCDYANRTCSFAKGTIQTAKSAIRNFLFELEEGEVTSFNDISLAKISDSITHMAKRYAGGVNSAFFCVRVFLKHLHENGFTQVDLSIAIPEMVAHKKVFREGFADDEIVRLLEVPNLETAIGKRDYAIMLLATQTGLRACDIANLKRDDIDWRTKEIRILQQKTGKPLSLPLEPESGNAIVNYLLNARPKSDLPYIFLCNVGILRPINSRSLSAIAVKYLKRAGITSAIPRRGFHSFRRSFGTRLLQNEIPLELLRQLLGHSKIDSTKPYLSVDEQGLKNCALGLIDLEKAGDLA